ncbi:MAG TPA: site-specific integrase [Amnibacterium sp.]|jgi:integrase|uniref:tyrosine-type recombinase/integrase n=1 Tax=Amnibacterium sp. TaxID=1872496 RepID=UPI002F94B9F1
MLNHSSICSSQLITQTLESSPRTIRISRTSSCRQRFDSLLVLPASPAYELAVFTGLRRGELAGLRWTDVDLPRRLLRVREQRVQFGSSVIEGPVKTDAGQDRVVALGGEAFAALIAWRARQDDERRLWEKQYKDSGYVFTMEDGRALKPNDISRMFEILVQRAGVPKMSVHGLRHQHASLMLAGGVDLAIVSKRLGHSTLAITSDLYSHLLGAANLNAAEAGEAVLPPRSRTVHTAYTPTPSPSPRRASGSG